MWQKNWQGLKGISLLIQRKIIGHIELIVGPMLDDWPTIFETLVARKGGHGMSDYPSSMWTGERYVADPSAHDGEWQVILIVMVMQNKGRLIVSEPSLSCHEPPPI